MAASNTDDRDDDVPPGDRPGGAGDMPDDAVEARWAAIVASLGDVDLAADRAAGPGPRPSGSVPSSTEPSSTSPTAPGEVADGGAAPAPSAAGEAAGQEGATDPVSATGADTAADSGAGKLPEGEAGDRAGRDVVGPEEPALPTRIVRPGGPRDWPSSEEVEALEEAESHFTPPEPPPLLSRDPLLTMAWGFVVGIPVIALLTVIVSAAFPSVRVPSLAAQIAVGLFLAGLATLVWRMPHHRDPDDDGPGAVV